MRRVLYLAVLNAETSQRRIALLCDISDGVDELFAEHAGSDHARHAAGARRGDGLVTKGEPAP